MMIIKRFCAILLSASLLAAAGGCADLGSMLQKKVSSSPPSQARAHLLEAERAMRGGHYDRAEKLYKKALQAGDKEALLQRARYGLACIAVSNAQNPEQFRKGLGELRAWAGNATVEMQGEDPRLLLPVLEEHAQVFESLEDCRQRIETQREKCVRLREERAEALKRVEELQQERRQLRKKIKELENLYDELLNTRKNL
jgi:tetratricopeptide (TPR) repeat protein